MAYETTAKVLLDTLLVAANAKTDEEKARVAWRFNDLMWRGVFAGDWDMAAARSFNNLLQDQKWAWVKDLWTKEEMAAMYPKPPEEPKQRP